MNVVLASASAIRSTLLTQAGIPHLVCPSAVDEAPVKQDLDLRQAAPERLVTALAQAKALDVAGREEISRHETPWILGADQILMVDGKRLDKPASRQQATDHLRQLRGKSHMLYAGVAVYRKDRHVFDHVAQASLTMRDLSDAFIGDYLDRMGESALSSVGCYQLEGLGAQLFTRIDGDYFTILGLPLLPLLEFFRQQKVLPL